MVNILISGANGRMGRKVFESCLSNPLVKAVCGVDIVKNCFDKDFPIYDAFDKVNESVDVVIDFSSPKALDGILSFISKTGASAVLCSTGYTKEDLEKIDNASKTNAIFLLKMAKVLE